MQLYIQNFGEDIEKQILCRRKLEENAINILQPMCDKQHVTIIVSSSYSRVYNKNDG